MTSRSTVCYIHNQMTSRSTVIFIIRWHHVLLLYSLSDDITFYCYIHYQMTSRSTVIFTIRWHHVLLFVIFIIRWHHVLLLYSLSDDITFYCYIHNQMTSRSTVCYIHNQFALCFLLFMNFKFWGLGIKYRLKQTSFISKSLLWSLQLHYRELLL